MRLSLKRISKQRFEELGESDTGNTDDTIGATVVRNKGVITDDGPAGEDDIGDKADSLELFFWLEEWVETAADHFFWMMEIEEERPDAILAVVFGNAMVENEPAGFGFDRGGVDADFFAVPKTRSREDKGIVEEPRGGAVEVER